ncbi:hypothetical protein EON71_00550 [bacterium]|nr:MAG: hypothetical protein EON71_00550 [bacterium]
MKPRIIIDATEQSDILDFIKKYNSQVSEEGLKNKPKKQRNILKDYSAWNPFVDSNSCLQVSLWIIIKKEEQTRKKMKKQAFDQNAPSSISTSVKYDIKTKSIVGNVVLPLKAKDWLGVKGVLNFHVYRDILYYDPILSEKNYYIRSFSMGRFNKAVDFINNKKKNDIINIKKDINIEGLGWLSLLQLRILMWCIKDVYKLDVSENTQSKMGYDTKTLLNLYEHMVYHVKNNDLKQINVTSIFSFLIDKKNDRVKDIFEKVFTVDASIWKNISNTFNNVNNVVDYFHTTKGKKFETCTLTYVEWITLDNLKMCIASDINTIKKVENYCLKHKFDELVMIFKDLSLTQNSVYEILREFKNKSNIWGYKKNINDILILKTDHGIVVLADNVWLDEIQRYEIILKCLNNEIYLNRRYPYHMYISRLYFESGLCDLFVSMYCIYYMLCGDRVDVTRMMNITDENIIIYSRLNEIVARFTDTDQIYYAFIEPFTKLPQENLLFTKTNNVRTFRITGIKDTPCIAQAIKSFIELKHSHKISGDALNLLRRYNFKIDENFHPNEDYLSLEQTIEIYELCCSSDISDMEAITLFLNIYTEGPILFPILDSNVKNSTEIYPVTKKPSLENFTSENEIRDFTFKTSKICTHFGYVLELIETMSSGVPILLEFFDEGSNKNPVCNNIFYRAMLSTIYTPLDISQIFITFSKNKLSYTNFTYHYLFPMRSFFFFNRNIRFIDGWNDIGPFDDCDDLFLDFLLPKDDIL